MPDFSFDDWIGNTANLATVFAGKQHYAEAHHLLLAASAMLERAKVRSMAVTLYPVTCARLALTLPSRQQFRSMRWLLAEPAHSAMREVCHPTN